MIKAYNHCIHFYSENSKNLFFIKALLQHHLPYKGICQGFFAKDCLMSSKGIASYQNQSVTTWQQPHQMGLPGQQS